MTLMTFVYLIAGLVLVVSGAEVLVRGAARLAAQFGIPPLIIGLTVVAFGTSAPETAVSVQAALDGSGDLRSRDRERARHSILVRAGALSDLDDDLQRRSAGCVPLDCESVLAGGSSCLRRSGASGMSAGDTLPADRPLSGGGVDAIEHQAAVGQLGADVVRGPVGHVRSVDRRPARSRGGGRRRPLSGSARARGT